MKRVMRRLHPGLLRRLRLTSRLCAFGMALWACAGGTGAQTAAGAGTDQAASGLSCWPSMAAAAGGCRARSGG
jgi:hypothetical protein